MNVILFPKKKTSKLLIYLRDFSCIAAFVFLMNDYDLKNTQGKK